MQGALTSKSADENSDGRTLHLADARPQKQHDLSKDCQLNKAIEKSFVSPTFCLYTPLISYFPTTITSISNG